MTDNNIASLSGEIVSDLTFSHKAFDERFYATNLSVKRASGTADIIPITVSERLIDLKADWKGKSVKIKGQLRSYNKHENDRSRLILSFFVKKFEEIETLPYPDDYNGIFLVGYVCKKPQYRETPSGKKITDLFLAVNRPHGKSSYIPCIAWGKDAHLASGLKVGTRVCVWGRVQSREYTKKFSETEFEQRIAYEVSISALGIGE